MGAGFTQMRAGIGCRIIHGDRSRFTMGVGSLIRDWDGAGGRTMSGDRRGFRGDTTTTTVVGRRCHRKATTAPERASPIATATLDSALILV